MQHRKVRPNQATKPKEGSTKVIEDHTKFIQDSYGNLFAMISNCEKNEFPHDAKKGFYRRRSQQVVHSGVALHNVRQTHPEN